MKLWEALEKGSGYAGKEFKHPHGYSLVCHGDVKFYYQGVGYGYLIVPNDGWYEVKQPVTWQEAIRAWAEGKTISYSYMGRNRQFLFEDSHTLMSVEKIKNAEWYVED